jgi:hypothetical protein
LPGKGKSFLLLAMANAIANGLPFAGMKTQQRPVIIFDRENFHSDILDRGRALGCQWSENFKVWTGGVYSDSQRDSDTHIEEPPPGPFDSRIGEYVDACKVKPVFMFDSLMSFFSDTGGKINDPVDVRRFMDGFRVLVNKGVSVTVAHHAGKTEGNYSIGSIDIESSADSYYVLTNSGTGGELGTLTLAVQKRRTPGEMPIAFTWDGDKFIGVPSIYPSGITNEEDLIRLIKNNKGIAKDAFLDLAMNNGSTRSRAADFLKEHAGREITVVNGKKGALLHTWKEAENEPKDMFGE